jgi:uncharacterized membrane protein YhhN
MTILVLTIITVVSGILCIRSKYTGSARQLYIFKPLTTILIFCIAALGCLSTESAYGYFIITGIFFSLWGDVFLMLPGDKFIAGLISFLVAHLLFITGFMTTSGFMITGWLFCLIFLLTAVILFVLLPHTGKTKIAVFAYMIVISIMAWQAWERWFVLKSVGAMFAGFGASLFLLSDFFLAYNRFKKAFKSAHVLVLGTYYSAIWLMAISI